jgi:hypothetical protein
VTAGEFYGNKLLEVLGEDKNGSAARQFKTEYILDKALKNPALGIKLTAAYDSIALVNCITVTSAGYEINDIKYKQFTGILPFDISFNDDAAALESKLGPGKGADDDVRLKYKKDGITVNVYFKSANKKKIIYIKFTQSIGSVGPYRVGGSHEVMLASADAVPTVISPAPAKKEVATAPVNKTVNSLPAGASFNKTPAAMARKSDDPFYMAIMNVIESGEEEMFKDIKKEAAAKTNFWNYKYTYSTSVKIPGEKYNMLYSFPFQSSQLDFVSVLEETNGASPSIDAKYAEVEAKLKQYFKTSEGWSYTYTVNSEDPKGIKDFELKNPKLGSIVLDHSINPYGKHVLYLRFLLQYT